MDRNSQSLWRNSSERSNYSSEALEQARALLEAQGELLLPLTELRERLEARIKKDGRFGEHAQRLSEALHKAKRLSELSCLVLSGIIEDGSSLPEDSNTVTEEILSGQRLQQALIVIASSIDEEAYWSYNLSSSASTSPLNAVSLARFSDESPMTDRDDVSYVDEDDWELLDPSISSTYSVSDEEEDAHIQGHERDALSDENQIPNQPTTIVQGSDFEDEGLAVAITHLTGNIRYLLKILERDSYMNHVAEKNRPCSPPIPTYSDAIKTGLK